MAAMTDFVENKIIDWLFRGQAISIGGATAAAGTGPSTLYVGLITNAVAPSDSVTGTEVSGNAYARVGVASSLVNWAGTQAAASTVASSGTGGTTSNNAAITFPTPTPSGWGTVSYVGIYDAASGGNLLFYATLAVAKVINAGDSVSFPAASLTFQIDN